MNANLQRLASTDKDKQPGEWRFINQADTLESSQFWSLAFAHLFARASTDQTEARIGNDRVRVSHRARALAAAAETNRPSVTVQFNSVGQLRQAEVEALAQ